MGLVSVAEPQTESELSVMLSLLEANSIPAFVQSGGFGGLLPGPQINAYNTRQIMVPSECANEARDILAILAKPIEEPILPSKTSALDKLRMLLEFLFLGWFIPGHQQRKASQQSKSAAT